MALMSNSIALLTFLYFIQGKSIIMGKVSDIFSYILTRTIVTFLYVLTGLPYGFQASFLPMYLRMQGVSLTNLSLFKLLLAPWLCKALWAPLVDKRATKQKWLLWSVSGLVFISAFATLSSPTNLFVLSFIVFFLNFFAATQDIAVDGIAVALLTSDELGKGNTAQVVGYKIGSIFGGGVLVWFMDSLGWSGLFLVLTLLYIEALLFIYLSPTLRNLHIDSFVTDSNTEEVKCSAECQEYTNLPEGECDNCDSVLLEQNEHDNSCNHDMKKKQMDTNDSFDSSDSNKSDSFEIVDDENVTNTGESPQHNQSTGKHEQSSDDKTDVENLIATAVENQSDLKHRKTDTTLMSNDDKSLDDVSEDNAIEMEVEEEEGEELEKEIAEFEPLDLMARWTNRFIDGKLEFIHEVVCVPGTMWMLVYVAIYKLGKFSIISH